MFDATNSAVQSPISASLDITGTHITIAFWAFVIDDQFDQAILEKPWVEGTMVPPYYQYGVEFQASLKVFSFELGFADGGAPAKLTIPAGTTSAWTHVAFTYDGTTMKGYNNGILTGQIAATGALVSRATALKMGVDASGYQGYKGSLDAVRIFNRTLTAAEIAAVRDGL